MSDKWTSDAELMTCYKSGTKHEWNGYVIVSQKASAYRWWVIQGDPAPYRDRFEYINDAKLACEVAFKNENKRQEI